MRVGPGRVRVGPGNVKAGWGGWWDNKPIFCQFFPKKQPLNGVDGLTSNPETHQ